MESILVKKKQQSISLAHVSHVLNTYIENWGGGVVLLLFLFVCFVLIFPGFTLIEAPYQNYTPAINMVKNYSISH